MYKYEYKYIYILTTHACVNQPYTYIHTIVLPSLERLGCTSICKYAYIDMDPY